MKLFLMVLFLGAAATDAPQSDRYPNRSNHVTSRVQEEAVVGGGLGITADGTFRNIPPFALSLIEDFEEWVPEPYNDASHYCTIGYGHLVARKPCSVSGDKLQAYANPLSRSAGVTLLGKDASLTSAAVSKWVQVNLTDRQFGALASFVFNVGADNFSRSSLLQYINAGNFPSAAREFGRWVKSNNKVLDGLVSRRACEAALFTGRIPLRNEGTFSRRSCSSLGAAPDSEDLIDVVVGER